ncbi:MAG: hypothetical protein JRI50_10745 [Deltaproteobacteria bacterium]|nr:hypothetical protein [Deltaproteobacteria bacterium]MBW1987678.1 hypothetical protein [Deltaproteobacteria bacterium]
MHQAITGFSFDSTEKLASVVVELTHNLMDTLMVLQKYIDIAQLRNSENGAMAPLLGLMQVSVLQSLEIVRHLLIVCRTRGLEQ